MEVLSEFALKNRLKLIKEFISKNDKVLDAGCGFVNIADSLKFDGFNAVGLDINPDFNVDVVADLNKPLPLPNESFDVVLMIEVLEHLTELQPTLNVLKENGLLIVSMQNPKMEWFLDILIALKLVKARGTPHINSMNLNNLVSNDLRLVSFKHLFFWNTQFAVFRKTGVLK